MKVGVFVLSFNRPQTTQRVIDSALHQTVKPEAVYVFNNNKKVTIDYPGCININSQENFLCLIRHAVAFTRDIDYWVFVDDDVAMKPKTIENFLKYSEKYPEAILGHYGRNIVKPGLYSLSISNWYTRVKELTEVHLVMGMIHFCKRVKLANSFILMKKIPLLQTTEDDIILSLGNRYIDKQKNYIIPCDNESGSIPLQSGVLGLSNQGGHGGRRVNAVRQILEWAGEIEPKQPNPPPKQKAFKPL